MSGLGIAVLTVSDTRTTANDTSGDFLSSAISDAGHKIIERELVVDNIYEIRATVSRWIADPSIDTIITTGGTGFSGRDSTAEALMPLFDKAIDGFGELFRYLSFEDIGTSTIQSRALGGLANGTAIFAVPGSTGACRLAWDGILREQLTETFKPCNFAELIPKLRLTIDR